MGPSNIAKMEKLLGAAYILAELYLLYKRKLGTAIEYETHLCPAIKCTLIFTFFIHQLIQMLISAQDTVFVSENCNIR